MIINRAKIFWEPVYADYNSGLTTIELSFKYNVSRPTIRKYFKKHGFKTKHRYKTGEEHHGWKGGRRYRKNDPNLYIRVGNKYIKECRIIWEKNFYPIPKGYDIHHIDFNPLNNNIDNLRCLTHSEHARLHMLKSKIYLQSPTGWINK